MSFNCKISYFTIKFNNCLVRDCWDKVSEPGHEIRMELF